MDFNIANAEKLLITAAMVSCNSHRRHAARALGIGERTLYRKLKEYGLNDRFSEKPASRRITIDLDTGNVTECKKSK